MQTRRLSEVVRVRPTHEAAVSWAAVALPLLALFGSFLGGATQRWSEGIVLAGFALLLLARPPRLSLGWPLNTLALLFLVLAATAFFPASWFRIPAWRMGLTNDLSVALPLTLSVQPWLSLDCSVTLMAGLAWIYYVTTLEADLHDIRRAARVFAGGMIAFAALCILLYLLHRPLPFWHNVRAFGPYPDRDQTGDLFGLATILVLGCLQDDFRRGHKRWIGWFLGVGVLVAALILDFSRAGILILILGVAAWLAQLAFRRWSGAGVAVAISVLLVLLTALLLFGGETIARFHLRAGNDESVTSDFRCLIFRDAWTMIQASPWCGVGLGNFESVFALFRDVSRGVTRSLHPEGDWLWLWSEMGWPAVVVMLVGFALFVRRVFPLREGTNQRLRYAALVGVVLFALHGLFDVSAHRLGTFLAGTLLLGFSQLRPTATEPSRWPPIVFRLIGVVLLVIGTSWFFGWRRELLLPGYVGVENAKRAAAIDNRGHRYSEALAATHDGLRWAPLDWQLYFIRGVARIGAHQPAANALADFRRARFLEPTAYELPFEEGKVWLGSHPTLALTAWREALRRRVTDPGGLYSQMFPLAKEYDTRVLAGLADFADDNPSLTIIYFENLPGGELPAALDRLLKRDPTLALFDATQKTRLFALWSRREQLDDLARAIAAHPQWIEFAWPGMARWRAAHGEFATAWQLVRRYATPPALPSARQDLALAQLQQNSYANPNDYAAGYALYHAQVAAGKTDDALATIRRFTAQPKTPAYFYYLQAETWAAKQNWERAWESWREFQQTQRLY
jgi:O-antigen ligase